MNITKQKVRDIVEKYTNIEKWDDNSDIFETLEIDSMNFVRILIEIEQELGKEIPSDYLVQERWKNINEIWRNVQNVINNIK